MLFSPCIIMNQGGRTLAEFYLWHINPYSIIAIREVKTTAVCKEIFKMIVEAWYFKASGAV